MALTLRQWRKAREITQEQMAKALNIHINTYQNWEKDPGRISVTNVMKIAEVLKVSVNDIIFNSEPL